jgi:hypothetical protein
MVKYRYLRINLLTMSAEVKVVMLTVMVANVDCLESVQVIVVSSVSDAICDVNVAQLCVFLVTWSDVILPVLLGVLVDSYGSQNVVDSNKVS